MKCSNDDESASTKEPVKEPIAEVVMDDAGDDVVRDDDQSQDASKPKTAKTPNPDWFKQPPRPPTHDPEWNKRQVILDQPEQPWFNEMVSAIEDPLTCNDLMATPIDFSNVKLEYHFQECFNALTDMLDWNNPGGDQYLKSSDPERTYTTSITKTKAARCEIEGIKDMVSTLWSPTKVGYDKDALKGIKHWGEGRKLWHRSQLNKYGHLEEIVVKRADCQLYKFKEGDFVDLHLNNIEDISLVIKKRVEDLQLSLESYHKKLNITLPKQTFPEIEFKELYTPSYKPLGVIYEDLTKQKRVMRADELYKFSDRTLKKVQDELYHRVRDFRLEYITEMPKRKWMAIDRKRSKLMVELIDKQMRERWIIRNLERLVGAWELEMDYKLMRRTVEYLNKQKRVLRADELYKLSDGTLKSVRYEIHRRVLDFRLDYNTEMPKRKWMTVDRKRSGLMIELINKQLREREIIRNSGVIGWCMGTRDGLQTYDVYRLIIGSNLKILSCEYCEYVV
ncbi:hypothetical protein Tco_0466071 [Tanacetum coccineum]